nr:MAG: putative glycoprotein [Ips virga-like virus 1]WPV71149.1 MAG: glycoprotein-like hypothetical protein [Ips phenuiviral-like virus]
MLYVLLITTVLISASVQESDVSMTWLKYYTETATSADDENLLKGSDKTVVPTANCTSDYCLSSFTSDFTMYIRESWGQKFVGQTEANATTSPLSVYVTNVNQTVNVEYIYAVPMVKWFFRWGSQWDAPYDYINSDFSNWDFYQDSYGRDLQSVYGDFPSTLVFPSAYRYYSKKDVQDYQWYYLGAPMNQVCAGWGYSDVWFAYSGAAVVDLRDAYYVFKIDQEVYFSAELNFLYGDDLSSKSISSNDDSTEQIQISDDVLITTEGFDTQTISDLGYLILRAKNTGSSLNVTEAYITSSVPSLGSIPSSGFGKYQIVKVDGSSQNILLSSADADIKVHISTSSERSASVIKSARTTKTYSSSNRLLTTTTDNTTDVTFSGTINYFDDTDILKQMYSKTDEIHSGAGLIFENETLINTTTSAQSSSGRLFISGLTNKVESQFNTIKSGSTNSKCYIAFTEAADNYLDLMRKNFNPITKLSSYQPVMSFVGTIIPLSNGLPDLTTLSFKNLASFRTSATIKASNIQFNFNAGVHTVTELEQTDCVIYTNAAGSYVSFSFNYVGSGGTVEFTSKNMLLARSSVYIEQTSLYTNTLGIREVYDTTSNLDFCVDDLCIDLSASWQEPPDGGNEEDNTNDDTDFGDDVFTSFIKYMYTGIISSIVVSILFILDAFLGVIVIIAIWKIVYKLTKKFFWLVWYLVSFKCVRGDFLSPLYSNSTVFNPVNLNVNYTFDVPVILTGTLDPFGSLYPDVNDFKQMLIDEAYPEFAVTHIYPYFAGTYDTEEAFCMTYSVANATYIKNSIVSTISFMGYFEDKIRLGTIYPSGANPLANATTRVVTFSTIDDLIPLNGLDSVSFTIDDHSCRNERVVLSTVAPSQMYVNLMNSGYETEITPSLGSLMIAATRADCSHNGTTFPVYSQYMFLAKSGYFSIAPHITILSHNRRVTGNYTVVKFRGILPDMDLSYNYAQEATEASLSLTGTYNLILSYDHSTVAADYKYLSILLICVSCEYVYESKSFYARSLSQSTVETLAYDRKVAISSYSTKINSKSALTSLGVGKYTLYTKSLKSAYTKTLKSSTNTESENIVLSDYVDTLYKKKDYATIYTLLEDDTTATLYANGNTYELMEDGPLTMECEVGTSTSICSNGEYYAHIPVSDANTTDTTYNFTKLGVSFQTKTATVSLHPATSYCEGILYFEKNSTLSCSDDCCLTSTDNFQTFDMITPKSSYKLASTATTRVLSVYTSPNVDVRMGVISSTSGCSKCKFACMMSCARTNMPYSYWFFMLSPLIIIFSGILLTLIGAIFKLKPHKSVYRVINASTRGITSNIHKASEHISNGNIKNFFTRSKTNKVSRKPTQSSRSLSKRNNKRKTLII